MALFKKDTPADMMRNEINSIHMRKSAAVVVINNEKKALLDQKMEFMRQIGVQAYGLHKNGIYNYDFLGIFAQIEVIDAEIIGMASKLADTQAKYDEEILMLEKNLAILENAMNMAMQKRCGQCGAPAEGDDRFCQNCGSML